MRKSLAILGLVMVVSLLGAGPAPAGEIGLKAIEARAGFVDIGEGDAGSSFLVSLFGDLGTLTDVLRMEAGVDFWTKGWDLGCCSWSWTNIGFVADVRYDLGSGEGSFRPYTFGGLALCYQSWDWDCNDCGGWYLDVGTFDDSSMEFGFNFGAGAEIGSGDGMTPVVRAGYNTNGGADYLYIQGGLRFPVGN